MIQVAKDDVLKGLKKFRRLAKQDLLASSLTSNPDFWRVQAETRRQKYSDLMELVDERGVDLAYELAVAEYAKLPLFDSGEAIAPEAKGLEQALEMFFTLLGVGPAEMLDFRSSGDQRPQNGLSNAPNHWETGQTMEV
ncbi:MAG: hypothetical protein GX354_05020 [Firmicutes bacterium]|jgi:hypothetical protein|nr:hypothetical protein [Bacillota bacterium]